MSGDVTLTDDEREALGDWWDSDWPDTAGGVMVTLYAVVERLVAERVRAAQAEALREAADGFDGPQSPLHITHASQALRDLADRIGGTR